MAVSSAIQIAISLSNNKSCLSYVSLLVITYLRAKGCGLVWITSQLISHEVSCLFSNLTRVHGVYLCQLGCSLYTEAWACLVALSESLPCLPLTSYVCFSRSTTKSSPFSLWRGGKMLISIWFWWKRKVFVQAIVSVVAFFSCNECQCVGWLREGPRHVKVIHSNREGGLAKYILLHVTQKNKSGG